MYHHQSDVLNAKNMVMLLQSVGENNDVLDVVVIMSMGNVSKGHS